MNLRAVLVLSFLLFLLSADVPCNTPKVAEIDIIPVREIDQSHGIPTYYAVNIPWFKQELPMSCGAAALKSAFGQLGYHLMESEIRIAAHTTSGGTLSGDMVRAAHFSNASEEGSTTKVRGYTGKPFGTDSSETAHNGHSPSGRIAASDFLKQHLLEGKPVILLMSLHAHSTAGHYRVLRGYDDRERIFLFTDSWLSNAESGSHWTVDYDILFEDYWYYSSYWAQVISPWSLSLTPTQTPAPQDEFEVKLSIDTGIPLEKRYEPWSIQNASANLELPEGYYLTNGSENTSFEFDSSGKALLSWYVSTPATIGSSDRITAGVKGWINGTGYHPWQAEPYNYSDAVYHETALNLIDWHLPELRGVVVARDGDGILNVNVSMVDDAGIQNVWLYWRRSATNWTITEMLETDGSVWQTCIPPEINDSEDAILQFRIQADDNSGNTFVSSIYESTSEHTNEISETQDSKTTPISAVGIIPPELIVVVITGAVSIVLVIVVMRRFDE